MKYYIICPERITESGKLSYWKQNKHGYTYEKKDAGKFTLKAAKIICEQPYVDDYYMPEDKIIYSGWTWDNIGEKAQQVKLPLGKIACPNCGTVASGVIHLTCGMCGKSYFQYIANGE